MYQRKLYIFGLAAILLISACNREKQATAPGIYSRDNVTISVNNQDLAISNHTGDTIYYTAFAQSILPVILWAPCIDPETCENQIPDGSSINWAISDILGTDDDDTIVFYWWHLYKQQDGTYNYQTIYNQEIKIK